MDIGYRYWVYSMRATGTWDGVDMTIGYRVYSMHATGTWDGVNRTLVLQVLWHKTDSSKDPHLWLMKMRLKKATSSCSPHRGMQMSSARGRIPQWKLRPD